MRSALEGHTHEQIAAAIGATPGAVRQLIYRARLTVRHGVGALIPLPIVRALAEHGAAGEAAAAGAVGGVAAAGAAGGGASLATKAAIIAAVGVVAAGSGVAIQRASRDSGNGSDQQQTTEANATPETAASGSGGSSPAARRVRCQ